MERKIYKAAEGMTFRRKRDGHLMGNSMVLGKLTDGTFDAIDNYEEVVDENPVEVRGRKNPHRPSLRRKKR